MGFGILTLISALTISAVAIYYSVAGLAAIFAAAVIPIVIMGVSLEVGKLVTAVWLHKNWSRAVWWLKTYLSLAVFVLMFITSMGIFGYLSKAHIEQTSASEASIAKVQQLESEISRYENVITRAEEQINKLETRGQGGDSLIQSQIDKEQERIDKAYERIQPLIEEQNKIIQEQTSLYTSQLTALDNDFNQLQEWINAGGRDNIAKVQGMVGTSPDGSWGFLTSNAVDKWREANRAKREELVQTISSIEKDNTTIQNARKEIERLRKSVEDQIAQSNVLINQLREQLGKGTNVDIGSLIDQENTKISSAYGEIEKLNNEKFDLESEYRKLEAEVGPIKYIAEFIYGEQADNDLLEEAVRWVIIVIIFVFDPLAVLLLIASQYSFVYAREGRENETTAKEEGESDNDNGPKDPDGDGPTPGKDSGNSEPVPEEQTDDPKTTEERLDDVTESTTTTNDTDRDMVSETDTTLANATVEPVESTEIQVDESETVTSEKEKEDDLEKWNEWVEAANKAAEEEEKVSVQEALETEPKDQPYKEIDETIKNMKEEGEWPPIEETQKKRETYLEKNQKGKQVLRTKK